MRRGLHRWRRRSACGSECPSLHLTMLASCARRSVAWQAFGPAVDGAVVVVVSDVEGLAWCEWVMASPTLGLSCGYCCYPQCTHLLVVAAVVRDASACAPHGDPEVLGPHAALQLAGGGDVRRIRTCTPLGVGDSPGVHALRCVFHAASRHTTTSLPGVCRRAQSPRDWTLRVWI